jgi:hypothetical protein
MAGEKSTYYVSVQTGSVVANEGDAAFEFEIEATEEEILELQRLFDNLDKADDRAFFRAHVPFLEYWHDEPNDATGRHLTEVYRLLHRLGTPETKRHIESMGVLGGELEREPRDKPADPVR